MVCEVPTCAEVGSREEYGGKSLEVVLHLTLSAYESADNGCESPEQEQMYQHYHSCPYIEEYSRQYDYQHYRQNSCCPRQALVFSGKPVYKAEFMEAFDEENYPADRKS